MRSDLPTGTVTFLFTDVEGSTRLLHELGEEAYAGALAEHRRVIREACAAHDGVEVDTQGDAFFYAFPTAEGALEAAREGQDALETGPIRVRLGLHTGSPLLTGEGYVGHDVHFAARMAACGHGGQILLSKETASLVDGGPLTSLGSHRLKDVAEPVTIYQLGESGFPPLKTIANSNLPTPASSFLGRDSELYEADLQLQETRLLTVTGPGGAGKTRFALQLAQRAREERFRDYEDGVYSAFLSSLREPQLVLVTIAVSLNVREQPGQSALEALSSHLQGKRLLLVLDNLEHLPESFRELAELLSACPGLTLLCTSRERLRLQGERVYELPPLSETESVSLFCERAQSEPDDPTRELCQKLEGLPLAIELAAARTSVLTPEQISIRLSQRLDFLKGGPDRDPRQETLRATIEWSYELLSLEEQQVFARLSVFAGGCTLAAAEEVADTDIDTLQSLVDKSLLRFTDGRYWLLESVREFAVERLEASGEAEEIRGRHAEHFAALSERAEPKLTGPDQGQWMERLEAEHDNIRTTLGWATNAQPLVSLRLAGAIWRFWYRRSHLYDGRQWLGQAIRAAVDAPPSLLAKALNGQGVLELEGGDMAAAKRLQKESLRLSTQVEDRRGTAIASADLALIALIEGDRSAIEQLEGATATFAELGDLWGVAVGGANLGWALFLDGDLERAASQLLAALSAARETGQDSLVALVLSNLGVVALARGDASGAAEHFKSALSLAFAIGDKIPCATALEGLAATAVRKAEAVRAATLLGCSDALRAETAAARMEDELARVQSCEEEARTHAGSRAVDDAREQGRAMTFEAAVAFALRGPADT